MAPFARFRLSAALLHALLLVPVAAPGAPAPTPRLSTFNDQQTVEIPAEAGTSYYGLGMAGGALLRNGTIVEGWNSDIYGYPVGTSPLYQTHPWLLALRADGTAWGLLADTTWRVRFDLTDGVRITAEGPPFPVEVFDGATPTEVLTKLAARIGGFPMPPRWALGYHQCRWSYTPESRVREIAAEFRRRRIPCDVLWLDIDYMHGFRCFTFDSTTFPDPAALNRDLHAQGFHAVWMIDPGIKQEPGYPVYDSGTAGNHWVLDGAGAPAVGSVWAGPSVFPDFTRKETRAWWAGLYRDFLATGIDGVWNDMNEPSVFDSPNKTLPPDAWHRADEELGGPGPHARYHNVYGMLMARATREGFLAARPERRPFVLTRAGFLGSQRYAATWTGDNTATWPHLEESVPMVLSLGLSGQPFAGPDIGGFKGRGDGTLFARWMGLGAFLPFARGHTAKDNGDKEPWSFGPEVESVCRTALEGRYRLLPQLYTLFYEAATSGLPVARPVAFADPADPGLRAEDDAFLLGSDLLVIPQLDPTVRRSPARPRGVWRRLELRPGWYAPPLAADLPEIQVRAGAIITLGPVREFVGEEPVAELELVVALDARGEARGLLYDDRGDGAVNGRTTEFTARRSGDTLRLTAREVAGAGAPPRPRYRVTLLTSPGERPPSRIVGP